MKKRVLVYLMIFACSIAGFFQFNIENENSDVLKTTVLHVFEDILEEHKTEPFDIKIEQIEMREIEKPKDFFNFSRYAVDVTVSNLGGELNNATVILSSDSQNFQYQIGSFNILENEKKVIEGYELLISGDANGGEVELEIEVLGGEEKNTKNNKFQLEYFDLPAKMEIDLNEIGNLGDDFELYSSKSVVAREQIYTEFDKGSGYLFPNSKQYVFSDQWLKVDNKVQAGKYYFIKKYLEDGSFAVSDVFYINPSEELSKKDFAELFVEVTKLEAPNNGIEFFEDVDYQSNYGKAVEKLYNAGLLTGDSSQYLPETKMTRAEALVMVMDYFDAEFLSFSGDLELEDVDSRDPIYPYVYAFYKQIKNQLSPNFRPNEAITKDYLTFMINAYQ